MKKDFVGRKTQLTSEHFSILNDFIIANEDRALIYKDMKHYLKQMFPNSNIKFNDYIIEKCLKKLNISRKRSSPYS